MIEEYYPILGHESYKCSKDGTIVGKYGKRLKGHVDRCGYREVILSENGKCKNYLVHRLILSTFKPSENDSTNYVNHKNGNKLDNKLDNLEWCTKSENTIHSYRTGLQKYATNPYGTFRVLTSEDEDKIRELYGLGLIDREIAAEIGCSREIVGRKIRNMGLR